MYMCKIRRLSTINGPGTEIIITRRIVMHHRLDLLLRYWMEISLYDPVESTFKRTIPRWNGLNWSELAVVYPISHTHSNHQRCNYHTQLTFESAVWSCVFLGSFDGGMLMLPNTILQLSFKFNLALFLCRSG